MPLRILKHLGPPGVQCLTKFLNSSAINYLPPTSWRHTKIVPLYKGKGPAHDPENYRSIDITPWFGKLFMAVINKGLTAEAIARKLGAPTQAGFHADHTTTE